MDLHFPFSALLTRDPAEFGPIPDTLAATFGLKALAQGFREIVVCHIQEWLLGLVASGNSERTIGCWSGLSQMDAARDNSCDSNSNVAAAVAVHGSDGGNGLPMTTKPPTHAGQDAVVA